MLFIDTNTKTAGVSLREDIIQNRGTEFGDYAIGDIIDDATVIRVDERLGLLMELSEGVLGFTHVSTVFFPCNLSAVITLFNFQSSTTCSIGFIWVTLFASATDRR